MKNSMQNLAYEEKLATQPMLPLIIKMTLPAILAQLVNLLYSIVDRIYIGRIPNGTDALAGLGITTSIIMLISAFSSIVGMGGSPIASIALGKGERERAGKILGNGFVLLIFFAIITSTIAYIFMQPLLFLIGASKQTIKYATDYLSIYLIGTVFVQISVGLVSYISCQGRPTIAMLSIIIGAVSNIILDPIFIYGFDMGVRGAALATIISQALSAIWVLRFLFSKNATLRLRKKYMKLEWKILSSMFAMGISPFVMTATESLIGFVLNGSLERYGGDLHVSAMTVLQSGMQIISVPMVGFAQGFVPVVSYNYGNRNKERVKEGFKIAFVVMTTLNLIMTSVLMIFPKFFARIFTDDILLIEKVGEVLPIFMAGMLIFGMQRACQNMFVALVQPKVSLFIALLRKVILLVPFALIFPVIMGENVIGVYIAEAMADGIAAVCCAIIFFITFPKILAKMD